MTTATAVTTTRPTTADVHAYAQALLREERLMNHGQWRYETEHNVFPAHEGNPPELRSSAVLTGPDCMIEIHHFVSGDADRVEFRAWAPWYLTDGTRFEQPYNFKRAQHTIAWGRPASAGVAALLRCVPNAEQLMAAYRERDTARMAAKAEQIAAVAALEAAGIHVSPVRFSDELEQHFDVRAGRVRIDGKVVGGCLYRVEVNGLDPAGLCALVALLRAQLAEEGTS